ncbi:DUF2564 family protein [Bacillus tianshenii]|nr:DUF2564 family protein [Bacillus tianshenii]
MTKRDDGIQSGFNQQEQAEMAVKAAQKMVGSATMSMEPRALQAATEAIMQAQQQLHSLTAEQYKGFVSQQQVFLNRCQEQLNEAQH